MVFLHLWVSSSFVVFLHLWVSSAFVVFIHLIFSSFVFFFFICDFFFICGRNSCNYTFENDETRVEWKHVITAIFGSVNLVHITRARGSVIINIFPISHCSVFTLLPKGEIWISFRC